MADWDAALYDRVSDPQAAWGNEVLARLQLRGDETVLDAGCGSGRLTEALARRLPNGRLIAMDLSAAMVRQARSRLAPARSHLPAGHDAVDLLQADLLHLPFQHALDVIFSTAVFHWVLDQPALARQLHGALRPGGRLHAQCGGGDNVRRLYTRADAIAQQPPFQPFFRAWQQPWNFVTTAQSESDLRRAGFRSVHTWLEPRPTRFPDAQAYRTFVAGIVLRHHLDALPSDLRGPFMDAIVAEAANDAPPFELDYWRLNIEATA